MGVLDADRLEHVVRQGQELLLSSDFSVRKHRNRQPALLKFLLLRDFFVGFDFSDEVPDALFFIAQPSDAAGPVDVLAFDFRHRQDIALVKIGLTSDGVHRLAEFFGPDNRTRGLSGMGHLDGSTGAYLAHGAGIDGAQLTAPKPLPGLVHRLEHHQSNPFTAALTAASTDGSRRCQHLEKIPGVGGHHLAEVTEPAVELQSLGTAKVQTSGEKIREDAFGDIP